MDSKDIGEFLESKYDEIVKFTQELVKTNSAYGNELGVAKTISKKLDHYDIENEIIVKEKQRANLISGNIKNCRLLFCGHMDTVSLGDRLLWKDDPLSGKYDRGKIYGRGSSDMKSGLAALTFAYIALKEIGLAKDVALAFTYAEEGGQHLGIRDLLNGGLKADACIVGEPTREPKIAIGQRGVYRFEATTIGKAAHTGMLSANGVNAVTKMSKFLLELEKTKFHYKESKDFPPPKITPGTTIEGGTGINIYPSSCKATVDCRLSLGQNEKTVEEDVNKIIRKLKQDDQDFEIKIKKLIFTPPAYTDPNEDIVKLSKKNIQKIMHVTPELKVSGGASDGNIIMQYGIPTVSFGPIGDNNHAENEYVVAKSISDISKVYTLTAIEFLSGS